MHIKSVYKFWFLFFLASFYSNARNCCLNTWVQLYANSNDATDLEICVSGGRVRANVGKSFFRDVSWRVQNFTSASNVENGRICQRKVQCIKQKQKERERKKNEWKIIAKKISFKWNRITAQSWGQQRKVWRRHREWCRKMLVSFMKINRKKQMIKTCVWWMNKWKV